MPSFVRSTAPTRREIEILAAAADGEKGTVTAQRLFISYETVRTHRSRVIKALGANNMCHAIAIGFREGILPLSLEEQGRRCGGCGRHDIAGHAFWVGGQVVTVDLCPECVVRERVEEFAKVA